MGLFDKIKKVFASKEKEDKVYDEGLKKSRNEFVSQLSNLSKKYKNISEDYFEELENILTDLKRRRNYPILDHKFL